VPATRYRRNAGSVFSLKYHLVWCPKYRRAVLTGLIAARLGVLLREKAAELGITIEALELMPDHVHVCVAADPTQPVQYLVNQFKGFTARRLRQEFPALRSRLPSLWSRSYYAAAVGQVSEETVRRYIADQKSK
jgi:putative transposase